MHSKLHNQRLRYSEAFYSVQGEGRFVGVPSVFLRTFGCNFRCMNFGIDRHPDRAEKLKQGIKYTLKADIEYKKKSKYVSIRYFVDNEFILQHLKVPIAMKTTDGPYGPNKPYIKIGIYRIGEKGTQTYFYSNIKIKNRK